MRSSVSMLSNEPIQHVERPIGDPPNASLTSRRRLRLRGAGIDDLLMGVMLLAGPANVIMQLSRPGVGYGVIESRVESGRADLHPIKRARTTFAYLAVAVAGTNAQKEHLRRAVAGVHAKVHSTSESPVQYDARDPELQLWVAACIYKGFVDVRRLFVGEMSEEEADRYHHEGMLFGTTLEVPPQMWPEDRIAFDRYWQESLDKVHIDDTVRKYLYSLAVGRFHGLVLPRPIRHRTESLARLITTGFLPQRFRDEMRLPWSQDKQRRFNRLMALVRAGNQLLPRFVRRFPFNVLLRDLDRRIRTGRPLL